MTPISKSAQGSKSAHGEIKVGEISLPRMAKPPKKSSFLERLNIRDTYPAYPPYENAQVVRRILKDQGKSGIEGILGPGSIVCTTIQGGPPPAPPYMKILEATDGGLDRHKGTGKLIHVAPIGNILRRATKYDFPYLVEGGGEYLLPRMFIYGEEPKYDGVDYEMIPWPAGSDRLLEAVHAVHEAGLFGPIERWRKKPPSLLGYSKGGLDALSGGAQFLDQYPGALRHVITVDSPIAEEHGGVMDTHIPYKKGWLNHHRAYIGEQGEETIKSITRNHVQEELEKLGTDLTRLKKKHLDLGVFSSIFSDDLSRVNADLPFYTDTAMEVLKATGLNTDGLVKKANRKEEPSNIIERTLKNHKIEVKHDGATDEALKWLATHR